ncbi:MAG: hypothetical protein IJG13_16215 [Kiritimatiellae bacterium]|nr:hypothetical protein [Kiritimatiellia bacterium]
MADDVHFAANRVEDVPPLFLEDAGDLDDVAWGWNWPLLGKKVVELCNAIAVAQQKQAFFCVESGKDRGADFESAIGVSDLHAAFFDFNEVRDRKVVTCDQQARATERQKRHGGILP